MKETGNYWLPFVYFWNQNSEKIYDNSIPNKVLINCVLNGALSSNAIFTCKSQVIQLSDEKNNGK